MTGLRSVQVSDLHLARTLTHHRENWEIVLEWLALERPELVIVSGDLADAPGDLALAQEQMARQPRKGIERTAVRPRVDPNKLDKDKADSGRHPITGPKDAPMTGAKGRGDG